MKQLFLISILLIFPKSSVCQKPLLDTSHYGSWPTLQNPLISNTGKFIMYQITNDIDANNQLVLTNTDLTWEKRFTIEKYWPQYFLDNDAFVVLKTTKDTLAIISLRTKSVEYITDVKSYSVLSINGDDILIYRQQHNVLTIRSNTLKSTTKFQNVYDFTTHAIGNFLIIKTRASQTKDHYSYSLQLLDLHKMELSKVWFGNEPKNIISNKEGNIIAFRFDSLNKQIHEEVIAVFDRQTSSISYLPIKYTDNILGNLQLGSISRISDDGKFIFIYLRHAGIDKSHIGSDNLNIWSYNDIIVQPRQIKEVNGLQYLSSININQKKIKLLENENKQVINYNDFNTGLILIKEQESINPSKGIQSYKISLINLLTNQEFQLDAAASFIDCQLSPSRKYIIYFNPFKGAYYSFNIESKQYRELTNGISFTNSEEEDGDVVSLGNRGIAGWLDKKDKIIIYDPYDIWLIDIANPSDKRCITNRTGRSNNIVFNLSSEDNKIHTSSSQYLLLTAFDLHSKDNGFYIIELNSNKLPKKIHMGPYFYSYLYPPVTLPSGVKPIKAKFANVYLLQRMTARESPNFFITKNFREFKQVSFIYPEHKVNWLTTELHNWIGEGSKTMQGILYKPENFDSTKTYPVIFYYYRKRSDALNIYLKPSYSNGSLNIPWYVSNGYLVFTPDIRYIVGQTGESALSALISAKNYLSRMPFVDTSRTGIQGISFGGFETNYIVTHTDIFTAACSASGLYDLVSAYNSVNNGVCKQDQFESGGVYQIGATLWENRDAYILNSPIFYADRLSTPLLMMQTTEDETVPLANAVEFYLALRRLSKKAWLLEYNKHNHGVSGNESIDFDLRMRQFFNHYLKGTPAPEWMIKGRPARLKGIDDRIQLIH